MAINMANDRNTISNALTRAGYDLQGNEPNLIQASRNRGNSVVNLYIDAGGDVRAQISVGGDENEQRMQSGRLQWVIIRSGQITINMTTTLSSVADIPGLLNDINNVSANRSSTTDVGNVVSTQTRVEPPPSTSGRVSASDFNRPAGQQPPHSGQPNPPSSYPAAPNVEGVFGQLPHEGGQGHQPSGGSNPSSNQPASGSGRVSASDFNKKEGGGSGQ